MIELSLTADFSRMERALQRAASDQVPFAAARAVNDLARMASVDVNRAMPTVFDRPTQFTSRAAVAPRALAAEKDRLHATVTLRPIQARYLLHEEVGGTRVPADNTRRPGAQAIVLPGRGLLLDSHGNIPAGTLRQLKQDARPPAQRRKGKDGQTPQTVSGAALPADVRSVVFLRKNVQGARGIGGFFARLAGGRLTRLTTFESATSYPTERLRYHARVKALCDAEWIITFRRRLLEAIASRR